MYQDKVGIESPTPRCNVKELIIFLALEKALECNNLMRLIKGSKDHVGLKRNIILPPTPFAPIISGRFFDGLTGLKKEK